MAWDNYKYDVCCNVTIKLISYIAIYNYLIRDASILPEYFGRIVECKSKEQNASIIGAKYT